MDYNGVIVEVDTDGIIVNTKMSEDKINKFINNSIKKRFGVSNPTLEMEEERFERGFIHMKKNYMLIEKDKEGNDSEIVHGAIFKSSRAPNVYDDAINLVKDWALYDKISAKEARDKAFDIRMRPIEDFVMNVRMSKNVKDYKTASDTYYNESAQIFNPITSEGMKGSGFNISGSQIVDLAIQVRNITGELPEKGDSMPYFTATDPITGRKGYKFYNPSDKSLKEYINYEEYENAIAKLFESTSIYTQRDNRKEEEWLQDLL